MSAVFGIFHRDGSPVNLGALKSLHEGHCHWGPDGGGVWRGEGGKACLGFGQARFFTTPEAPLEHLPYDDATRGLVFTAAGRVDNRDALIAACKSLADDWCAANRLEVLPDGDLIYLSYLRWGEDAPRYIYGDWAFAVYHVAEQRLFLARDHFGNTAMYYYLDARTFAFASDRHALLSLGVPRGEIDELYLAQVLVSWPAYHGERTVYTNLKRLPPAHTVTVTPKNHETRQYWRLEETPLLHLAKRQDYVEALRDVFDQAVRARLRVHPGSAQVASSLSGGLDSSSVTVTAARMLRATGQTLDAYTSVPLSDPSCYVGERFADEWPYAQETAASAANVRHVRIDAAGASVIEAFCEMLKVYGEPVHAAGNFYWIQAVEHAARTAGSRVFLTGQLGNAGLSWTGNIFSQPLGFRVRQMGVAGYLKAQCRRLAPVSWALAWQRQRTSFEAMCRSSAIHPDFARRLNLFERLLADLEENPSEGGGQERCRFLMPGRSFVGALHAQSGAGRGLEKRDPTGDARLLAFTFSVPDWVFMDPQSGIDRWLIRAAMQGRLPDAVRLNRRRGRQAGDLVPRLRAEAQRVEAVLDDLARGPAAVYLDVPYLRQSWQMIRVEDTPQAFLKATAVLTRGMMAGLFLNAC
ncbi:MAG: asparagine synthase-related protein [Chloroflexota bacterium]